MQTVLRAHRWFKEGMLDVSYPAGVPECLRRGLETYDAALNAIQVHDLREDREDRKKRAAGDRKSMRRKG